MFHLKWRNTKNFYFQIIPSSIQEFKDFEKNKHTKLVFELNNLPIKTWADSVHYTPDNCSHTTEMVLPELPAGRYFLKTSDDSKFENASIIPFQTSDLQFVTQNSVNDYFYDLKVVHRNTGLPLEGTFVNLYSLNYSYESREYNENKIGQHIADKSGIVSYRKTSNNYKTIVPEIFVPGDTLRGKSWRMYHSRQNINVHQRAVLFTDRSIYRPGQSIYFKAIQYESNSKQDNHIVSDKSLTVELINANWKVVQTKTLKTNAFGSINSHFDLPSSGLNGQWSIRVKSFGSKSFRVEEYKRPKFEIIKDSIHQAFQLNDTIALTGKSKLFIGLPTGNAGVSYTIYREELLPGKWFRRKSQRKAIGHGNTTTDQNGQYKITFQAKASDTSKTYHFVAEIKIIDNTGENHTIEQSVSIGKNALFVNLTLPKKST